MRKLVTPLFLSVFLLALLSGCASRQPLTGLAVEVLKLERGAGGTLTATLQVANSSVVAFNIDHSKHQLFVDGRLAGTIEISEPLGLPAQQTMTETAQLKPAGSALVAGPASYRLESTLTLLLYGDSKEIDQLSYSGTVQVP